MQVDSERFLRFFNRFDLGKFFRRTLITFVVLGILGFAGYQIFHYATTPDTLQVVVITNNPLDPKSAKMTFTHTTRNGATVRAFYTHLQRLPLATSVAPDCPATATEYHYTLTFMRGKTVVLTATLDVLGCPFISAYGVERAPDARFWALLAQIVGNDHVPPSPQPVVSPTPTNVATTKPT